MAEHYHEPTSDLTGSTRDVHRALMSLKEELEAVDWYQQRIDASGDEELRRVLEHNRDDEIEHAAMVFEWLRRRVPKFDEEIRRYLFTVRPITEMEESGDEESGGAAKEPVEADRDLGLGDLDRTP